MEGQQRATDSLICQREMTTGICILGVFICSQCEARLVASKATHSGYDKYVERLRVLWQRIFDADVKAGDSAGLAGKSMEAVECLEPSTG